VSKQTVTKTSTIGQPATATNAFSTTQNNNFAFSANPPPAANTVSTFSSSTKTTNTKFPGLTDQTATSANNLNTYTGTAVTQTQQKNQAGGFTTNTITTGVITQPFIKKTTLTSDGYNYPVPTVPCYGANKVCTPNQYCVNGFVNEDQLQYFDSSNQVSLKKKLKKRFVTFVSVQVFCFCRIIWQNAAKM
jgi:hypothetical protein